MYKYFISFCLLFILVDGFSQEKKKSPLDENIEKDSIVYKSAYGFRVGIDISKPIIGAIQNGYSGLEIVGDYRVAKRFYIAAELGFEEENTIEDYTNSTSTGNYIRIGGNFNAYNNWLDMNNEVFLGLRYGFSAFDQTLNSYTPNNGNTYFTSNEVTIPLKTSDLKAHWGEFVLGMKVETLKNLFLGASFSYKIMMSVEDPENFKTLYVPGFNRVFESNTGFGFNYTVSYIIPFVNK
jgi:hypothetical protein